MRDWKPEEEALLGTLSDVDLAGLLGRTKRAVRLRRQRLGIPDFDRPRWSRKEDALLGTASDSEIAKKVRRSLFAVAGRRHSLGIRSWRSQHLRAKGPPDPGRIRLYYGPYSLPKVKKGGILICERRGKVQVGDYSHAPIPWPFRERTRSLILCDDLVRAVRQESELAVAYHWGVSVTLVAQWRRHLGVEPINSGTRRLKQFTTSEVMTPSMRRHLSKMKTGWPANLTPAGKRALMRALKRPKSEAWRKQLAPFWISRQGKPVDPNTRVWTKREDKLLGKYTDKEVARRTKRSVGAVRLRRCAKKIPMLDPKLRPWLADELKWVGRIPDAELAQRTQRTLKGVRAKRRELRMLIRPGRRPWSPYELKLAGTMSDSKLARRLGRPRTDVVYQRKSMGLPSFLARPPFRPWTPDEDRQLGTDQDAVIAKRLGRTQVSVQLRRLRVANRSKTAAGAPD